MRLQPWPCVSRYVTLASAPEDGVTLQSSRVFMSCSRNHSPGGSAIASLVHGVSWFRRLFMPQV